MLLLLARPILLGQSRSRLRLRCRGHIRRHAFCTLQGLVNILGYVSRNNRPERTQTGTGTRDVLRKLQQLGRRKVSVGQNAF